MIYAVINETERTFDTWSQFHTAMFSPSNELQFVTSFRISGKDYSSRKAAARDLGVKISGIHYGGLTWSEYNAICNKMETIGKRYGLLEEFRENGLC